MKYRAICFDFDYTLGDSTDSIVAGFQYGFTRLGWPAPDRETVRRTVGYLLEDAYTLLTGDRDPEHRAALPSPVPGGVHGAPAPGDHSVSRCPGAAPGAEGPGDQAGDREHQAQ